MEVVSRFPVPVGVVPWRDDGGSYSPLVKLTYELGTAGWATLSSEQVPISEGDEESGRVLRPSDFAEAKGACEVCVVGRSLVEPTGMVRVRVGSHSIEAGRGALLGAVARGGGRDHFSRDEHRLAFPSLPLEIVVEGFGETLRSLVPGPPPDVALVLDGDLANPERLRLFVDAVLIDPRKRRCSLVFRGYFSHPGPLERGVALIVDPSGRLDEAGVGEIATWPRARAVLPAPPDDDEADEHTPPLQRSPVRETVQMPPQAAQRAPEPDPSMTLPAVDARERTQPLPFRRAAARSALPQRSAVPAAPSPPSPSATQPMPAREPRAGTLPFIPSGTTDRPPAPPAGPAPVAPAPVAPAHIPPPAFASPPAAPPPPAARPHAPAPETTQLINLRALQMEREALPFAAAPSTAAPSPAAPFVGAGPSVPKPANEAASPRATLLEPTEVSGVGTALPFVASPPRALAPSAPKPRRGAFDDDEHTAQIQLTPRDASALPFDGNASVLPFDANASSASGAQAAVPAAPAPDASDERGDTLPPPAPSTSEAELWTPFGAPLPPPPAFGVSLEAPRALVPAHAPPPAQPAFRVQPVEPPKPVEHATDKIPMLTLEEYAALRAELWSGERPRREVLRARGLSELRWRAIERKWAAEIDAVSPDPLKLLPILSRLQSASIRIIG